VKWLVVIIVLTVPTAVQAEDVPGPLKCLARWYAVKPLAIDGRWFLALPDGTRVPYDDGRKKSFEEELATPDVKDSFSLHYTPGKILPVSEVDFDPGRVRLDGVFKATYGESAKQVDLVSIEFLGQPLRVHRKVAEAFKRVAQRLATAREHEPSLKPFLTGLGGTFLWRTIAGTTRLSAHSFGVSIDLNPALSNYWRWSKPLRWQNKIPQAIVDAFEAEGFIWGGRWYHYDTMHFEYRPELLAAECYPR
jgi:hypothetical protein